MAAFALDDVQIVPPCSPVKDLIAADEFIYVTGITSWATPILESSSQHLVT